MVDPHPHSYFPIQPGGIGAKRGGPCLAEVPQAVLLGSLCNHVFSQGNALHLLDLIHGSVMPIFLVESAGSAHFPKHCP